MLTFLLPLSIFFLGLMAADMTRTFIYHDISADHNGISLTIIGDPSVLGKMKNFYFGKKDCV